MARKGLIFLILLSFAFAQLADKENFETGTLMAVTGEKVVINEATYILDERAEVTDIAGNKIPLNMVKLPAECRFQTNIMAGKITDQVKIVKIVVLRPVPMESYGKKPEKTE